MQKIKIISGWSDTGGSTEVFIGLTNEFNKIGLECTFYGPHDYHLNKCKSDNIENIGKNIDSDDILICHFLNLHYRPPVKKVILSCHEKGVFNLKNVKKYWDVVVFLNEEHKNFHNYSSEYEIIPNLKNCLEFKEKPDLDTFAGIIGSIDPNKMVHVSIQRALDDGCKKVYIFGSIRNVPYFEQFVKPLLSENVIYYGFLDNKQKMYDSIGRVYHSSESETWCLIKDECETTGTKFLGLESSNIKRPVISNQEIIQKWINIFDIKI